jgi:hypothetical protein
VTMKYSGILDSLTIKYSRILHRLDHSEETVHAAGWLGCYEDGWVVTRMVRLLRGWLGCYEDG